METSLKAPWNLGLWIRVSMFAIAGLILLWPSAVVAAVMIDQQQLEYGEMDLNSDRHNPFAQTFRPGVTGRLEKVSLMHYNLCGAACNNRRVEVQIVQGEPSATSVPLATAEVTVTSPMNVITWYDYVFASPPILYQDAVYSIIVTGPVGTTENTGIGYTWWTMHGTADPYPRGGVWCFGLTGSWQSWEGTADASDFAFKTWMTPNTPPTVATNVGLTVTEGATATITSSHLSVADLESAASELTFTVTAAPVNGALLKNDTPLGSDPFTQDDINSGWIKYQHDGSESTADSFSFALSDGIVSTGTMAFPITVSPSNDPPVLSGLPAAWTVNEDTNTTLTGIGVADVDLGNNALSVTLSAGQGNLTLGSTAGLTFVSGGNGEASMTFTGTLSSVNSALSSFAYRGAPDYSGPDTISVTVSDQGFSGSGGAQTTSGSVPVTVAAVNDAPAVSGLLATYTVYENTDAVITGIGISDPDVGAGDLTVALAVSHGAVSLGTVAGLTFTNGANGLAAFTFTGPAASVYAALGSLTYRGEVNYVGPDTLSLSVSDQGNTGAGGDLTGSASAAITVAAVNTEPSFTQVVDLIAALQEAGMIRDGGLAKSLLSKVEAAEAAAGRGNYTAARNQLGAMSNELEAQAGRQMSAEAAEQLSHLITGLLERLP